MVTGPTLIAVTTGVGEADWVWPAAKDRVAGEIVALLVLLLDRDTVTPPGGAGVERVTGKATVPATSWTLVVAGTLIVPGFTTFTVAVASGMFGELALRTVEPAATPVTGTPMELLPAGKKAVEFTVATPGLVEVRLTRMPPGGAALESDSVMFCVVVPVMVRVAGDHVRPKPTSAVVV